MLASDETPPGAQDSVRDRPRESPQQPEEPSIAPIRRRARNDQQVLQVSLWDGSARAVDDYTDICPTSRSPSAESLFTHVRGFRPLTPFSLAPQTRFSCVSHLSSRRNRVPMGWKRVAIVAGTAVLAVACARTAGAQTSVTADEPDQTTPTVTSTNSTDVGSPASSSGDDASDTAPTTVSETMGTTATARNAQSQQQRSPRHPHQPRQRADRPGTSRTSSTISMI